MNGTVYQLVRLVSYVKKNQGSDRLLRFPEEKREHILFNIAPEPAPKKLCSTEDWCRELQNRRLEKILLYIRAGSNDPMWAGFVNRGVLGILTVYGTGVMTLWMPDWQFNRRKKIWQLNQGKTRWEITYTERACKQSPDTLPVFRDPTEDFITVLQYAEPFARELHADYFAGRFRQAYEILTGTGPLTVPGWMKSLAPMLEADRIRMLLAASHADVFGGMGSWNDVPGGIAQSMGRSEEYDKVSKALYYQSRMAVMYAINH